ncbi:MAG: hypothetical protein GY828_03130 [Candidatus Gracilibacteria bacterium]|nr:hypothetical protein [Candidatus Gracilibacteria bacterium]
MKVSIKIVFLCILCICIAKNSFASYELNKKEIKQSQIFVESIQKTINENNPSYKKVWEDKFENLLNRSEKGSRSHALMSQILQLTYKIDLSGYKNSHYKKFNIDKNKIEKYWLDIHNRERNKVGLFNYQSHKRLENTATQWSYDNYEKLTMDHKRDVGDSFYNYHKIENWFQKRGVSCPVKGRTTASESIGHFGFYCFDGECSDEFNASVQKIFDIYMAEKGLPYPQDAHYRAIVSPHISQLGLGVTFYETDEKNYYEYYMATHYCTELKK